VFQILIDHGCDITFFQTLVMLQSMYHCGSVRLGEVSESQLEAAYTQIDKAIRMFVDGTTILKSARDCIDEPNSEDHSQHRYMICVGHLRWREREVTMDLSYWNFASAARVFNAGYLQHECSGNVDDYYEGRRFRSGCYHTRSIDLLYWLLKNA